MKIQTSSPRKDSVQNSSLIRSEVIICSIIADGSATDDHAGAGDAASPVHASPKQRITRSANTAEILVQKLIDWDVQYVFGIIGDGINPIVEALRKYRDKIGFITVRHEEAAAFMACGYAKYTGKLSVCLATSGPGAVHLMNGIYDAYKDRVPLLAITGAPFHDLIGTDYTQEIDTLSLMREATLYNEMITGPQQAKTVVDLACRAALAGSGVAHLTIAKDVQQLKLTEDKRSEGSENLTGSIALPGSREVPADSELQAAAAIIVRGKRIGILAGRGALGAGTEIEQLADLLAAPVTKALLGKAVLPDDSPYTTGGIGHLGSMPSKEWMQECDTLLILGSNMPYLEYYPKKATTIQIDNKYERIGLRCPVTAGLKGDVKATLQALLPMLKRKDDRSFLEKYQDSMAGWRRILSEVEEGDSDLVRPQYLAAQVGKFIDDNATVSIDTGAHTIFAARHWQLKSGQQMAVSGNLASMGPGLPYAIAAQLAYPGRQCVAMVGDGGFTMLMGELATAVRYKLPVKIIIFKNNQLSQDVYEQKEMGNEVYGGDLTPIDFVKIAEACGADGFRCDKKSEVAAVLKEAFSTKNPTVIEVLVDPGQAPSAPDHILQNKF